MILVRKRLEKNNPSASVILASSGELSLAMCQRTKNGVEYRVELLPYVLGEKAQNAIAVFLQQLVLATVASIGDGIRQMLRAVQFNGDT